MKSEGIELLFKHVKDSNILEFFNEKDDKIEKETESLDSYIDKKILNLFQTKKYTDVSFSCLNVESNEMEIIPAHKGVLACRSEYFEKMFTLGLSESTQDVIELDLNSTIAKIILNYLYCETPNCSELLDSENVIECLYAADLHEIRTLKLNCEHFIVKMIDFENFETLVDIADEFNCPVMLQGLKEFSFAKKLNHDFKE
jgi:hypothetical protein